MVFLALVGLLAAYRRQGDKTRSILFTTALLGIALAILWPTGMKPVIDCYPDISDAPNSVTSGLDDLGEIHDRLTEWQREQGTEKRFFATGCGES